MMWEEKVKRTEMSLFQEEFVRRGLRLVHDAPDQVNPAVDTCIGYAAVLGAEVFTEMEGMVEEVCQGGPRQSPEIQSTLVWSSCWGATGSAGRSTQREEQRKIVRARGNKGEVGVTRDQCRVW